ncbi:MAG: YolD-like family protein [Firmicutes bacterium]|nr:YolD-like family protein [Bacillota bacterium]
MGKYDDIINLPHHKSATRKQMSRIDRAAMFAPYMALSGYSDDVKETARLTDTKIDLSEIEIAVLNRKLNYITENLLGSEFDVTYFVPDSKKEGGKYEVKTGNIRRINDIEKKIIFSDKTEIAFSDILDIEGDFPDEL